MANPRSRLFLIGAAVLAASVPVLADNHPEKSPEVSTVVYGPQGPTAAEIAKLDAVSATQAVAPPPDMAPIAAPVLPKPAEITTIVVGPTALTAQELAKLTASVAPAPVSTTTPPAAAPAPTTTTPAPAEK